MYKWTDDQGIVHFSDTRPSEVEKADNIFQGAMHNESSPHTIEFYDGFEYDDSPVNHGWRFTFGGNDDFVFTTSERAHFGSKCLKGFQAANRTTHTRFGLSYDLSQKGIGKDIGARDTVDVVIHWYDDGVTKSDYNFHPRLDFRDADGMSRDVCISDTGCGQYAFRKSDSYAKVDICRRWRGWHKIKYRVEHNRLDLYFDGKLVSKGHAQVTELQKIFWSSNIISPGQTALSWIDDVRVTRTHYK
ncbi:domain of unknown function duf4124 [Desulfoluna spongiiphila]|nr:domain of unknown function duf4124 [Desulfoluna spongiiphila]